MKICNEILRSPVFWETATHKKNARDPKSLSDVYVQLLHINMNNFQHTALSSSSWEWHPFRVYRFRIISASALQRSESKILLLTYWILYEQQFLSIKT